MRCLIYLNETTNIPDLDVWIQDFKKNGCGPVGCCKLCNVMRENCKTSIHKPYMKPYKVTDPGLLHRPLLATYTLITIKAI